MLPALPVSAAKSEPTVIVEETAEEEHEEEKEIVIAQVDNYVNIRSTPSLDGEIVGKLYNNSIGTVLEHGEWILIESGNVKGYVSAEYVLTGQEAKEKADENANHYAVVNYVTVRIREKANKDSITTCLVEEGKVLKVLKQKNDDWFKVSFDGEKGYISSEYVDTYMEYEYAESREEEEERLRKEAEETARIMAAASTNKVGRSSKSSSGSKSSSNKAPSSSSSSTSGLGQDIASYALQFKGNPYVYGGTSLTNGADCSGFVQSVFKNFGISLPRTSSEQGAVGTSVSLSNAKAGDIVSYSGHVGIYIGNGKIISASNSKNGIRVTKASYRPVLSVRRVI